MDWSVPLQPLRRPNANSWPATQRLGKAAHGVARRRSARRRSIRVMGAPHFSGLGRAGRLTAERILRGAGLPANRGGGDVPRGSWQGPKPTPAGAAAIACRATRLGCERGDGGAGATTRLGSGAEVGGSSATRPRERWRGAGAGWGRGLGPSGGLRLLAEGGACDAGRVAGGTPVWCGGTPHHSSAGPPWES